jgi:hypothetical protein
MLHWNHWVLKENGDPDFLRQIRTELPDLYLRIFREGDGEALDEAIHYLRFQDSRICDVFVRYLHRRKVLSETEDGITSPEGLAGLLARYMLDTQSTEPEVLEVTSPQGRLNLVRRSFQ